MQPNDPLNNQQPQAPSPAPAPRTPSSYPQPLETQSLQSAPSQPTQAATQPTKRRRKLALWLLIGPSALFVIAMIVAFTAPALFPDQPPAPGEMFGEQHPARTIANIFAFLSGAVVILTWLPGIIIGIILLAKR